MEAHEIKGQYVAKRAFEVATAGDLSILLVGPRGSSKSTLRGAFPDVRSAEMETCPCGHFQDVRIGCVCSVRAIIRWYRRLERKARDYDIILECCPITARDMLSNQKPDIQEQGWRATRISEARKFGETHTSVALSDDSAFRTMELALRRLALTMGQYNSILRMARAIANLDGSAQLTVRHVAEAVQYRADATAYRIDRLPQAVETAA